MRFFPIFSWSISFFNTSSSFKKIPGPVELCIWKLISSLYQRRTGSKSVGYNFFNWTTRNMHQKFSYFPRPSIRATPIHSRHLYFPPVSTFGLPEHEFLYSLKVQCILNLAKYFFHSIVLSFIIYSLCKLTCKFIHFIFIKIGSTNKYETLNETIPW